MATRRRKLTDAYVELLQIPEADLVAIGRSVAAGARPVTPDSPIGYADLRVRDGRGARTKFPVSPMWMLNLGVLFRLAELHAEIAAVGYAGDRKRYREKFLRDLRLWSGSRPPSRNTIKRWRDLWPDQGEIDDAILEAWRGLRKNT